ncbi:hypothetical protein [Flavobacterium sp.]|uniref:hypothetical protein n=1 Tax=Flavobacterium sp. TaxID=239 RepID=UPI002612E3F6|nr:hypothetical protein [Flavobacterium sp.]
MKTLFKKSIFLLLVFTFFSCSEDGKDGKDGVDGNANVIGTNTVTTSSSNWSSNTSGSFWYTTLSLPAITQSIIDKGVVSLFKSDSNGAWIAMPYTIGNQSWYYEFGVGFINIYTTNTNLSSMPNPATQKFRVVVISASNRIANPNVNWKNYDEVKYALNLED